MRKKNGFLLTELLISFSLSFIILLVIFNTTISLSQKLSDLYIENKAYSQQIVLNRKIADDMAFNKITNIGVANNRHKITITYDGIENPRVLEIDSGSNPSITYNGEKIQLDSKNMRIDTTESQYPIISYITSGRDCLVRLNIPIYYIRNNKNFGIELFNIAQKFITTTLPRRFSTLVLPLSYTLRRS